MTVFTGPPVTAIRNKPIAEELRQVLDLAARAAGIEAVYIKSGGQDALGQGTRRTGSTRHDRGRAADVECRIGGKVLTFTDRAAPPAILAFVTHAAASGATGIGAGLKYMGNKVIHIGFGKSGSDRQRLTWGAAGAVANAPGWLREAAAAGWAQPAVEPEIAAAAVLLPGLYEVVARNGLKLRGGPGTDFGSERSLPAGTQLHVVETSGTDPGWVRVDLEGDGLLDGYVFAAFLQPAESEPDVELAPEPDDLD